MKPASSPASRPWSFATADGGFTLQRDGVPALLLGGQVSNSSSSSTQSIAESFSHVRRMHGNTVLAPVSWAISEPREGAFDFALVDRMIDEARRNDLRLVLLWFGAFKNAGSNYAPTWVRGDRDRFPRAVVEPRARKAFTYEGATAHPVLSVFSEALREADATAFEALLRHIVNADPDGLVVMVQVENESGVLTDSRDRGPDAQAIWSGAVPAGLLAHVRNAPLETSLARRTWEANGSRESGTWPEVFGDSSSVDEVFMAWAFAGYVEYVAARGKAVADVLLYANAWLGPQPGQDNAGQYPSGGPSSRVLDIWRAAAPSLALLGPDIYIQDAESAMRDYATGVQPFFIPESRPSVGELVRAVGTYRAVGWSTFGVDVANPDGQVAATLAYLTALEAEIAAAQASGAIGAVVIEAGVEVLSLTLDEVEITARPTLALFQRMLLDAGVRIPDPELDLPHETVAHAPVPHFADTRSSGLLIGIGDDTFIVVGRDLTLDFFAADTRIEIDCVEELLVEDGRIVQGRVLNGDERLRVVPTGHVGAARIRLVRV